MKGSRPDANDRPPIRTLSFRSCVDIYRSGTDNLRPRAASRFPNASAEMLPTEWFFFQPHELCCRTSLRPQRFGEIPRRCHPRRKQRDCKRVEAKYQTCRSVALLIRTSASTCNASILTINLKHLYIYIFIIYRLYRIFFLHCNHRGSTGPAEPLLRTTATTNMAAANFVVITNGEGCALTGTADSQ